VKLEYANHQEKREAFTAIGEFSEFLKKYGYNENARRLEDNLFPFIAKIPVAEIKNPCKY